MKIARVFIATYPGRNIGDIFDVVDLSQHPGVILIDVLKEVEVADDFDPEIVEAIVENGEVEFVVDGEKLAAKLAREKAATGQALYAQMQADVLARMVQVFGTSRTDSATAYYETWKLMVSKPDLFVDKNLTVDVNMENAPFMAGEPLDTFEKVMTYATFRISVAEGYSVYRLERIEEFRRAIKALV